MDITNKTLSGTEIKYKMHLLREYLRKHKLDDALIQLIEDARVTTNAFVLPLGSYGDQITEGLNYSTWADLDDITTFASYLERLYHYDSALVIAIINKFKADSAAGGHVHNGADGQGPLIPPQNVTAPVGAINGHMTVLDHLLDDNIHSVYLPPDQDSPVAFYDNFEQNDISTWWNVLAGSPSRWLASSVYHLYMPAGTRMRLRSAPSAWGDRFTIEFDLYINPAVGTDKTFLLHVRQTESGTVDHIIFRLSLTANIGIYKSSGMTTVVSSSALIGNIWRHFRIQVYGPSLVLWNDVTGTTPARLAGIVPVYDTNNGYIEMEAIGECRVRGFFVSHTRETDAANYTDGKGRFQGAGTNQVAHAITHHDPNDGCPRHGESGHGTDPLDIANMGDGTPQTHRLLTGAEKAALFRGGPDGNLHAHSDLAVNLSPLAVGGCATIHDHVRNGPIHGSGASSPTVLPKQPRLGYTGTPGTSGDLALRDHTHAPACYLVEVELVYFPYQMGTDDPHWSLEQYAKPEFFAANGGPGTYPHRKLRKYVPTIYGEFCDMPGADLDPMNVYYGLFDGHGTRYKEGYPSTLNPSRGEEYHRIRLPLVNLSAETKQVSFMVPTAVKSFWFTVCNSTGMVAYPGMAASPQDNYGFFNLYTVDIYPGKNDLIFYVVKQNRESYTGAGFGTSFQIWPYDPMLLANGVFYPKSFFEDGIEARVIGYNQATPVNFPTEKDPTWREPADYLSIGYLNW